LGFLQRFFHGRNGTDHLNAALAITAVVFTLLGRFFVPGLFAILAYVCIFLYMFRMMSRNIPKRRGENLVFLRFVRGISAKMPKRGVGRAYAGTEVPRPKKDRANFRYLKCPGCKKALRVPRGKGRVKITCSACKLVFYKKV